MTSSQANRSLSGCFIIGSTTVTPEVISGDIDANTGDAKEVELFITNNTGSDDDFAFDANGEAGTWFEIDELELREVNE